MRGGKVNVRFLEAMGQPARSKDPVGKGDLTLLWDLLYRSQWTRVAVVDADVDVVVIDMAR